MAIAMLYRVTEIVLCSKKYSSKWARFITWLEHLLSPNVVGLKWRTGKSAKPKGCNSTYGFAPLSCFTNHWTPFSEQVA